MGTQRNNASEHSSNKKKNSFLLNKAIPALIMGGFILGAPLPSPRTDISVVVPHDHTRVFAQSYEELAFLRACESAAEEAKRERDAANRLAYQDDLDEISNYKYGYFALTAGATAIHPLLGLVYGGVGLTHISRMESDAAYMNERRIRASDEALTSAYEFCETQAEYFTLDAHEIEDTLGAHEIAEGNRINRAYFQSLDQQQMPRTTTYAIPYN